MFILKRFLGWSHAALAVISVIEIGTHSYRSLMVFILLLVNIYAAVACLYEDK